MKRQVAILVVFCMTALTGCVTGGFSDWDGRPTEQTVQTKNNRVQKDVNEMRQLAERVKLSPPPAAVISEAKKLYFKLKKLDSIVESGRINYNEYSRQANDIKADLDIFSSEYREYQGVIALLDIPVRNVNFAAQSWERSITDFPSQRRGHTYAMETCMEIASTTIKILDDTLYKIKK